MPKGIKGFQKGHHVGRPKANHTLLAQEMRKKVIEYVEKELMPILEAKMELALGHSVIVARKWEKDKKGRRHRTGPFEVVKDEATISQLISDGRHGVDYYKIVTEKPDNQAQNYLLDQAIGRAKETMAVEGPTFQIDKAIMLQLDKIYGKEEEIIKEKYEIQ